MHKVCIDFVQICFLHVPKHTHVQTVKNQPGAFKWFLNITWQTLRGVDRRDVQWTNASSVRHYEQKASNRFLIFAPFVQKFRIKFNWLLNKIIWLLQGNELKVMRFKTWLADLDFCTSDLVHKSENNVCMLDGLRFLTVINILTSLQGHVTLTLAINL